MTRQKILLTGVAGFIGFHVASQLLRETSFTIIGLDNINNYYDESLKYGRLEELGIQKREIEYNTIIDSVKHSNLNFIKLNLEDKDAILDLFKKEKFDIVINLAAQAGVRYSLKNPFAYVDSNITGFLTLLEATRAYPIRHLVFASSSSVYGANTKVPFNEEDKVDSPVSLYAATKKSNELMAYAYSHLYGIPMTGLRFFTVYGPWGRPDMAYFIFTRKILNDETINIYNNGNMKRDFTYIDDIVFAIKKLLSKIPQKTDGNPPYRIFNIGNNKPINLLDFVNVIEDIIGKKAKKQFLPMQQGDVVMTYADISELNKLIGFTPTTSIETGIKKFIEWYREFYKK